MTKAIPQRNDDAEGHKSYLMDAGMGFVAASGSRSGVGGGTASAASTPKINQQKIIQKDSLSINHPDIKVVNKNSSNLANASAPAPSAPVLSTNGSAIAIDMDHNSLEDFYKEPMQFGTANSTTITTQIGANAHLPCIIHHIGEGVVSFAVFFTLNVFFFRRIAFSLQAPEWEAAGNKMGIKGFLCRKNKFTFFLLFSIKLNQGSGENPPNNPKIASKLS